MAVERSCTMSAENKKVTPLIEIKNCVMEFPGVKALDYINAG